ncbi:PQQ-dependent sugar dehydrogenase [Halomonas salifodinae]|uniref:PQQ-dependent sugar dehydrogenase n=1 Tax=Halomonas salifodinae TaxID=438745 RepID=A0ABW2F056_9GAMM
MMRPIRPLLALLAALVAAPAPAAEVVHERLTSDHHDFRLVRLAEGLSHPWSLAFLPDGRMLVSERGGRLWLLDDDARRALDGLPAVSARGQGGLLDLALHPDFGSDDGDSDWLYFTYSRPGPGGSASALARARLGDAGLTELTTLFVQDRYSDPGRHYGGRLAFLPDGSLVISIGDRGRDPDRAQDGGDHAGGVLRLTQEGTAPMDNPFVNEAAVLDELYSLGNRNIQGLTVDGEGRLWASEHGPRGGDELNRIEAGANYGWPEVSLGRDYVTFLPIGDDTRPGMRDPVHVFEGRFAPSGLAWVSGGAFPGWRGSLLAGGLLSERLVRLVIDGDRVVEREVLLEGEIGRIRDVRVDPDGRIYLLSDASDGGLYRLEPLE